MHFNYFMPTKIVFGKGRLKELANEDLPGSKALIVMTSGQSMRKFGYLEKVVGYLDEAGVESIVFDKILPNPVADHVMEAAELARNENCDIIVGLGGGSAIDSAKSIAIMVNNPGTYWDYVKGLKHITEDVLPIIAIPTTAGTGTESDPWTVITNSHTQEKVGYGNEYTFPYMAFVDPELMVSVPANLTAYQGMDAFFHSVEGYLANVAQPVSDLYALDSIRRITKYLPIAVADGYNMQAREELAWASTQAGMVESTSSCISQHSMEHALSAFYPKLPHGAGLIGLSASYFSYFLKKDRKKVEKRYMEMAKVMGEKGEKPEEFVEALKKLISAIGLDDLKLTAWGLKKEDAEKLAENSFEAMGFLYELDPIRLNRDDAACVIREAIN